MLFIAPTRYRLRGWRPKLMSNIQTDKTFSPAQQQFGIPLYISPSRLKVVLSISKIPFLPITPLSLTQP